MTATRTRARAAAMALAAAAVLCAAAVIARRVLVPLARADAPQGRFVVDSNVVRDQLTHLTWQRGTDNVLWIQSSAAGGCARATTGGLTGWRLPTIDELQSIVDVRSFPAIDPAIFDMPPKQLDQDGAEWMFHSATPDPANGSKSFVLVFAWGGPRSSATIRAYLRCVHD